jgi:thymidine kinase
MNKGEMIVIYGNMFCGKTSELHRIWNRYQAGCIPSQFFKPVTDRRYSRNQSVTHDNGRIEAIPIASLDELKDTINSKNEAFFFDEFQFFTTDYIPFILSLVREQGKRVAVAGLSLDYRGEPFHLLHPNGDDSNRTIMDLVVVADDSRKQRAVCTEEIYPGVLCNAEADFSQRFLEEEKTKIAPYADSTLELGATNIYAARCFDHFKFYPESNFWH